jgi:tRNA-dihydrouridine synthase
MEDVTDTVFRQVVAECGKPDVMVTEFVKADVIARPPRRAIAFSHERGWVWGRLRFAPVERPLVAQLWGSDPGAFAVAAATVRDLGFDGVDINMGCPARKIRKKGAGAALIHDHTRTAELLAAAGESGLPVSIKTRIGTDRPVVEEWVGFLLEHRPSAITLHMRLADQLYGGEVDWESLRVAVRLRNAVQPANTPRTRILGNGDITALSEIGQRCAHTGADGMMVGRAVFADPYFFNAQGRSGMFRSAAEPERLALLRRHLALYEQTWEHWKHYDVIKRFYKTYLAGFPGADELRDRLNRSNGYQEAWGLLERWQEERIDGPAQR